MRKNRLLLDYILITFSSLLMALAVMLFFKEHMLAPGGITGMSIVINALTGFPVEFVSLGISVPLLIMSIVFLGKSFGIKTLYITLTAPLFLKIIPQTHVTSNLLVAGVIGGLLVGSSIGIAIIRGCATGGTDLLAMMINKAIKKIKMPVILFLLDGIVIIGSGVISKNYMVSLYSLISLLVIIVSISFITRRFSQSDAQVAL